MKLSNNEMLMYGAFGMSIVALGLTLRQMRRRKEAEGQTVLAEQATKEIIEEFAGATGYYPTDLDTYSNATWKNGKCYITGTSYEIDAKWCAEAGRGIYGGGGRPPAGGSGKMLKKIGKWCYEIGDDGNADKETKQECPKSVYGGGGTGRRTTRTRGGKGIFAKKAQCLGSDGKWYVYDTAKGIPTACTGNLRPSGLGGVGRGGTRSKGVWGARMKSTRRATPATIATRSWNGHITPKVKRTAKSNFVSELDTISA